MIIKWAKNWWNLWKEPKKRREIYINRDSVCLYNENKKNKKIYFFIKKKSEFGSGECGNWTIWTKTV